MKTKNKTMIHWALVLTLVLGLSQAIGETHPGDPGVLRLTHSVATATHAGPLNAFQKRARIERETILRLVSDHRRASEAAWADRLTDAIFEQSVAVGLDPLLVAAIAARESSFRSRAVSHAGAVGLMQIRPFVARDLAQRSELAWNGTGTLHEPESNIRLGALYYLELEQRFSGNTEHALAAYHRGPTRLARQLQNGRYSGSSYADRVRSLYRELDEHRSQQLAGSTGAYGTTEI